MTVDIIAVCLFVLVDGIPWSTVGSFAPDFPHQSLRKELTI